MTLSRKSANRYELERSALYGLRTVKALSKALLWHDSPSSLRALSKKGDNFSEYEQVNRVTGKRRKVQAPKKCILVSDRDGCAGCARKKTILAPIKDRSVPCSNRCVKSIQKRLNILLKQIVVPAYLQSGIPGRSHLSNSKEHLQAVGATVTVDVSDFYPSISRRRIFRLFRNVFFCAPDVADVISDLVCFDGHLATGCPASVLLSFFSCKDMFDMIDARAKRQGATFTLYIDAIAITGNGVGHGDLKFLSTTLSRFGFHSKKSKSKIFCKDQAKVVTGRAFRNGISRAPNRSHLRMRDALSDSQASVNNLKKKRSAIGKLEHVSMLDEERGEQFKEKAKKMRSSLPPVGLRAKKKYVRGTVGDH